MQEAELKSFKCSSVLKEIMLLQPASKSHGRLLYIAIIVYCYMILERATILTVQLNRTDGSSLDLPLSCRGCKQ